MHTDAFGLAEDPFKIAPSLRFVYRGPDFAAALGELRAAVLSGRPLSLIVGEGGLGKTALLKALAEDLRQGAPQLAVSLESCGGWSVARSLLDAAAAEDGPAALLLDEAHHLPEAELRALAAGASERALRLVLAGAPALAERLAELAPFSVRLQPIDPAETPVYVRQRLVEAGGAAEGAFSPQALRRIAEASQGVPRAINRLCSTALFVAATAGRTRAEAGDVEQAVATLGLEPPAAEQLAPPPKAPPPARTVVLRAEPLLPRVRRQTPPPRAASRALGAAAALGAAGAMGLAVLALTPDRFAPPAPEPRLATVEQSLVAEAAPTPAAPSTEPEVVAPPAPASQSGSAEATPTLEEIPAPPPALPPETIAPAPRKQAAPAAPKPKPAGEPPAVEPAERVRDQAAHLVKLATEAEERGDWIAAVERLDAARAIAPDRPDVLALDEARRLAAAAVRPAEPTPAQAPIAAPASQAPQPLLARRPPPPAPLPARPPGEPLDARLLDSAERVEAALARGADPDSRYQNDHRPLTLAARDRRPDLVATLLRHGADPNAQTRDSATALMYAAWNDDLVSATFLLQGGAAVDPVNLDGKTPLMAAATRGHAAMAELLLRNGARADAQNLRGWTALMYASWGGHRQIVDLLLRSGADPNLVNRQGHSAAELAELGKRPALARSMAVPAPVN